MKTLVLLVVFFCFTTTPSFAFDDWSKTDYALQGVYTVLHVIDWGQTLNASNNPSVLIQEGNRQGARATYREMSENNIILGKHPSTSAVHTYFAGTLLLHAAISYVLPSTYRKIWQCVTIGYEGYTVGKNFNAGVTMDF